MQIIASDAHPDLAAMLNGYEVPAILVTPEYRIVAANDQYLEKFGEIPDTTPAHCYRVSHGYDRPCDQAGEDCPLAMALESGHKERVLHIHQTPRGSEHVDVELLPIHDSGGQLLYFVELLKPVRMASPRAEQNLMVGKSPAFNRLVREITRVGPTDAAVLLLGESGTGKELAALALHQASPRRHKSMVTLECAGLTETLFESELFGHVKGAFTGAVSNKQGLAEAANGGTLFLDEIGDVPLDLQVKLLRLLETGTYRPVGSSQAHRTDFRLVCATHKDLPALVEQGRFRQDLYYRINVYPIRLPALRDRPDDIALLTETLLLRIRPDHDYTVTESALALLRQHAFRGNVRELRNLLSRAVVLANTNVIDRQVIADCLAIDAGMSVAAGAPEPAAQDEFVDLETQEQRYLRRLLAHCGDDKEKAAAIAGISVRSLYRKLQGASRE